MNTCGKNLLYGWAWKIVRKTRREKDVEFLRSAYHPISITTARIRADLDQWEEELKSFSELRTAFESYKQFIKLDYDAFLNRTNWPPLLYFLIRIKKPDIVIETGSATGLTTSIILYGLQHNQTGCLYSIDLRIPLRLIGGRYYSDWITDNNLPTAFLVPESLKTRWSLILKDAKVALPELLSLLGHVDFFYHDSDHSYVHQMWEYLTAWPYIPAGGVLTSDDLSLNAAFFDFSRQCPERSHIAGRGRGIFGMIVKR
jgi:hypothetical protein